MKRLIIVLAAVLAAGFVSVGVASADPCAGVFPGSVQWHQCMHDQTIDDPAPYEDPCSSNPAGQGGCPAKDPCAGISWMSPGDKIKCKVVGPPSDGGFTLPPYAPPAPPPN